MMEKEIREKLIYLADKYENPKFSNGDPSFILNEYQNIGDLESASFITAMLSFGQREQFLKKVHYIFDLTENSPSQWLKQGKWKDDFPQGERKFYRFYSFDDLRDLFQVIQCILEKNSTLGEFFERKYLDEKESVSNPRLDMIIAREFESCSIVPHGKNSANKRIHMFLRWMVRNNSPVDKGIWQWFDKKNLIIPLDTHVLQEAEKLNLIAANSSASYKTACKITECLKEIWPDDPVRGDFALFGLGVDKV